MSEDERTVVQTEDEQHVVQTGTIEGASNRVGPLPGTHPPDAGEMSGDVSPSLDTDGGMIADTGETHSVPSSRPISIPMRKKSMSGVVERRRRQQVYMQEQLSRMNAEDPLSP